jgi:hypothetical protein
MQNIPFSIGNGGKMSAGVKPNATLDRAIGCKPCTLEECRIYEPGGEQSTMLRI